MTDQDLRVKRFIAYFIDGVIGWTLTYLIPFVGPLVGFAYFILRDGLPFLNYNSLGKKLMGLNVSYTDGRPTDMMASVKRNWFLALSFLPYLLTSIGILESIAGFASFAGFVLVLIEGFLVATNKTRLGDKQANTMVSAAGDFAEG